jgi:hypothetical protein
MDIQEVGWGAWTGLLWLRIGTGGGRLWMREELSGSLNAGISWLAEDLLVSQEGLCSMDLVL